LDEGCETGVDFALAAGIQDLELQPFRPRSFLRLSLHALGARIVRVDEQRDYLDLGISLAGTIIGITPVLLMIPMVVEFHALNDMVTEPDTDIGVRLYVVRH
jgi:hypothetical protein